MGDDVKLTTAADEAAKSEEISNLKARVAEACSERDKATRKFSEIASDRDRWKARAEKAEDRVKRECSDVLTKERDNLKTEVISLSRQLSTVDYQLDQAQKSVASNKAEVEVALQKVRDAEAKFEALARTTDVMQRARDAAQAVRDKAVSERDEVAEKLLKAGKEIAKLTADLKKAAQPEAAQRKTS